jgi:hypothetical protein
MRQIVVLGRLVAPHAPEWRHELNPSRIVSGGGNVDESRRFENPVRLTVKN